MKTVCEATLTRRGLSPIEVGSRILAGLLPMIGAQAEENLREISPVDCRPY